MKIKLSDLAQMSQDEKDAALSALTDAAKAPTTEQQISDYKAKIAVYEQKYELTSDEMRSKLSRGEIDETLEICHWLMDLTILNNLVGRINLAP